MPASPPSPPPPSLPSSRSFSRAVGGSFEPSGPRRVSRPRPPRNGCGGGVPRCPGTGGCPGALPGPHPATKWECHWCRTPGTSSPGDRLRTRPPSPEPVRAWVEGLTHAELVTLAASLPHEAEAHVAGHLIEACPPSQDPPPVRWPQPPMRTHPHRMRMRPRIGSGRVRSQTTPKTSRSPIWSTSRLERGRRKRWPGPHSPECERARRDDRRALFSWAEMAHLQTESGP